jgi:mono/diheme cytochrome c family protein
MRTAYILLPLGLLVGCGAASGDISSGSGDTSSGASLYAANCASCHGADAQGGSGPNIAGIGDSAGVIDTILNGTEGMPGFASSLSDTDVSDILAYLGGLSGGGGGGGEGGEGGDD